jgi:hypothetical protein
MSDEHPTVAEIKATILQLSRDLGERASELVKEKKAEPGTPTIDALERASAELARTGMLLERFLVLAVVVVMIAACGPAFTVAPEEGPSSGAASSGSVEQLDAGDVDQVDAGEVLEDGGRDAGLLVDAGEVLEDAGGRRDASGPTADAGHPVVDAGGGVDAGSTPDAGDAGGPVSCDACPPCAGQLVICCNASHACSCRNPAFPTCP